MHKVKIVSITLLTVLLIIVGIIWLQPSPSIVENIPEVEYADDPVPDFNKYERVQEKKGAFFNYLRPAIDAQNDYIKTVREYVKGLQAKHKAGKSLTDDQREEMDFLLDEYRVDGDKDLSDIFAELLVKIDIIPPELVLVQSANESAWGTSRFAKQGYNFFGLWCFRKGCGFVPKRRNDDASHEVAKFDNLSSAMYEYMRTLNSHPAYTELRAIRKQSRSKQAEITAYSLAEGLTKYSERGQEYVEELHAMMRVNKELMAP